VYLLGFGDIDDYGRLRVGAHEHWRMMDYYFKEVSIASLIVNQPSNV